MLKTRIITALVGVPLLLGLLYLGNPFWKIFFVLLACLALYEFNSMMKAKELRPFDISAFLFLLAILLVYDKEYASFFYYTIVLISIFIIVLTYPRYNINDVSISIFAALYIAFLMHYAIKISYLPEAFFIILLVFLISWSSDTGGYFFGKYLGQKKLAPQLSPKKTWAGALGGILLTIISTLMFFYIWGMGNNLLIYIIIFSIVASIAAQIGDLFVSSMKRYFQVKDTGNIIPGHGGVLDRFDSFILVVPLVYYFFIFIIYK